MSDGGLGTLEVADGDGVRAVWRMPDRVGVDIALIGALAHLQLIARRHGWAIRLVEPRAELRDLLELVGLGDLGGLPVGSVVEMGGEPEGFEELGRKEVVEPGDDAA